MIAGFALGHHTADGSGWLTGTTVVSAPDGAVGGVDVRGGGPGTRETDLLDPVATVERVDAVVLTGGSAYGLAAADGVMRGLEWRGRGFPMGEGHVVPIVPAAVIFDLGRGGDFGFRPDAGFGLAALDAATLSQATAELPGAELPAGASLVDALVATGLVASRNAARRVIGEGGVWLNIIAVVLISIASMTLLVWVFGL